MRFTHSTKRSGAAALRSFRCSLATVMAILPLLAFGFAALKYASALWASAVCTLAVLVLSLAVVGAIVRRGRGRVALAMVAREKTPGSAGDSTTRS